MIHYALQGLDPQEVVHMATTRTATIATALMTELEAADLMGFGHGEKTSNLISDILTYYL